MNKNVLIVFTIALINLQLIFGAGVNIVNVDYNFSGIAYEENIIHESDSILLRVTTPVNTLCYYTKNEGILPREEFDGNYGTKHEKTFENLEEGVHTYYLICGENNINESTVMKVIFKNIIPIFGEITISNEPPLREGQYEVNLVTSKPCLDEPILEYTFDGTNYKQIYLKGEGTNWKGFLIIGSSLGELTGSFRFKANDLAGRQGTKIIGDKIFIVDTIKPSSINVIDATGYSGQIKLDWFYSEKVKEFYIYRDESPNVENTNYYKSTNKNYFFDNDVERGKTYYYRIAGVDFAGNIGELSKEVYATALLSNASSQERGLDAKLIGKVDNLLSEIDSLIGDFREILQIIELKETEEKELFNDLKLGKEIENSVSELNSLKRDIEKYKLQDLTELELENKLNSAKLKLNIIKKKVPEDLIVLEKKEIQREINEENIQKAILEYFEYSKELDKNTKKEVSETLKISKEKKIKIKSEIYLSEITYIDGTKKEITIVKEYLDSEIEVLDDFFYIIILPKDLVEKASDLKVINLDYEVIKEDPVLAFNSDTKRITYYIEKKASLKEFENVIISPIKIVSKRTQVTGNAISDYIPKNVFGIAILVVFILALIIYFIIIKEKNKRKPLEEAMNKIKTIEKLIDENKIEDAKKIYSEIKEKYKELMNKHKEIIFSEINKINEKLQK